jgi:hypothetical protein
VQSGFAIYNLFAGQTDADKIVGALNRMTARLEESIAKLAKDVKDGTQVALWQRHREKTVGWRARILTRVAELTSFDKTTKTVELVSGEAVSVTTWCEGENGVLAELATILEQIRTWLEASDPGALNPVAEWNNLLKAGTAGRLFGGADENVTSLMGQWFYAIAGLMQTATWVRNAALGLYRVEPNNKPSIKNLDRVLDRLGCMSGSTASGAPKAGKGAWTVFEETMKTYANVAMLDDSGRIAARESYDDSKTHLARISDDHYFRTGGFIALPGSNSYIAGLNFGHHDGAWGVHATIVACQSDGTLKVLRDVAPGQVEALRNEWGNPMFVPYQLSKVEAKGLYLATGETTEFETLNQMSNMVDSNPHNFNWVMTGIAVIKAGDGYYLKMQMGALNLDPYGKMWVINYHNGAWATPHHGPSKVTDYFRLVNDVDQVHRGVSGTASLAPLTNASFTRVNTYHGSMRTRCIWPYRPDVLQPTFLKQFSPPNVSPPAAMKSPELIEIKAPPAVTPTAVPIIPA